MKQFKIMIVCPVFRGIEKGIVDSFKRIGCDVFPVFFHMGMNPRRYIQRLKLHCGLSVDKFLAEQKRKFNEDLMIKFKKYQPDFVYVIQGRWVDNNSLIEMNKSAITALYLWDMVGLFPEMKSTFENYRIVYSFDRKDTQQLCRKGINAKFKPSGYDNGVYKNIDIDKCYDITFVGAMYPERVVLLKKLIADMPYLKWSFYGEYAPARKPISWLRWKISGECRFFVNKNIPKEEVNNVYNKSRIVLSIVRENQTDGWSARIPEILGSGAFQLTSFFPAVEEEFGDCLATYVSYDDLVKRIKYYLKNSQEREEIALRGRKKVEMKYSDDALNKIVLEELIKLSEQALV